MNPTSDKLSPQQSLDLISQMISQAKGNVRENSFYYLFWGWIIVAANLGVFLLTQLHVAYAYYVWLIVIPGWIITFIYSSRQSSLKRTSTHLEQINVTLWISFGIIAMTIPFIGRFINYQINPVILLAGSIATATSGAILKYNPLRIGGLIIFVCGVVSFFIPMQWQPLVCAFAIAAGYLVPGYMLKRHN